MSKPRHIRTFPRRISRSCHSSKVDIIKANISERWIFHPLYQASLQNLHTPNILNCDTLHKGKSIRIKFVIWVAPNITWDPYSLPCLLHIHMRHCYILYESTPATVGLNVNTNSHFVKVDVFSKYILHPTRGFTANSNPSKWRWSTYAPDGDVRAGKAISNPVFIPSTLHSHKIISSRYVWILYAYIWTWICINELLVWMIWNGFFFFFNLSNQPNGAVNFNHQITTGILPLTTAL